MVEERLQFTSAHPHGMTLIVKIEVLSDPAQVGFFKSDRAMFTSQSCFNTIEDIQRVLPLPLVRTRPVEPCVFLSYANGWVSINQDAFRPLFAILMHSVPVFYPPMVDFLSPRRILNIYCLSGSMISGRDELIVPFDSRADVSRSSIMCLPY